MATFMLEHSSHLHFVKVRNPSIDPYEELGVTATRKVGVMLNEYFYKVVARSG